MICIQRETTNVFLLKGFNLAQDAESTGIRESVSH